MYQYRGHLFLILSLLLTKGCAVAPSGWPAELPDQNYFRAVWQADERNQQVQDETEYLLWVERFYLGYNMVPGWLDMTTGLLERMPTAESAPVLRRLDELGRKISAEWAKDNALRKIDTGTAATWRDALLESLSRNELYAYLDRLEQDVDALLAGELGTDDIYFERYYIDEFDF